MDKIGLGEPEFRVGVLPWKLDSTRLEHQTKITKVIPADPPVEMNYITTWHGELKVSAEIRGALPPEDCVDRVVFEVLKKKFEPQTS